MLSLPSLTNLSGNLRCGMKLLFTIYYFTDTIYNETYGIVPKRFYYF